MKKASIICNTLIVFSCFISANALAQAECSIKNFNTSNGLPQNTITAMTFDHTGYLWLGTQNGLLRYDGHFFKPFPFQSTNLQSDVSNTVLAMFNIPGEKEPFIRTVDGLLYVIHNGKPVLYSDKVRSTFNYELYGYFPNLQLVNKFNQSHSELIKNENWDINSRQILPVNNKDFIILGNNRNVLYYYKNGVKEKEIQLTKSYKAFLKSNGKNLMVDADQNFYLFDEQVQDFKKVNSDIDKSKDKTRQKISFNFYWDYFNNESYCYSNFTFSKIVFNEKEQRIETIPCFSVNEEGHFFTGLLYDKTTSTFFLRTLTEGLFQVKLKKIQTFNLNKSLPSYKEALGTINYSVLKTSDTTALTTTGFEFTTQNDKTTLKKLGNIHSNRETMAILNDRSILCASGNKLLYFNPSDGYSSEKVYNDSFATNHKGYISLIQPEGDSVWIGTNKNLSCITRTSFRSYEMPQLQGPNPYYGFLLFYRINKDKVLVSNKNGFYTLTTTFPYRLDTFPDFKEKQVRHITRYKDFLILSVYKKGLCIYKDNKFYPVTSNPDYPQISFCHSTYIDKNDMIWITTDKGLYKSSVSGILESAFKTGIEPFLFSYGVADGVDNLEFNGSGVPPFAALNGGQLFYPSMGGIVSFNPEDLTDKLPTGFIPIEQVEVDGQINSTVISDTIRLKADFKYLIIDLDVPYFGEPANLVLQYKIDNGNWMKIPDMELQKFVIPELSTGYHIITIRKRTGFESTDYVYKTLTIYRGKHVYEETWFYPVIALILTILILLFTKLNTRNINRKRKQLQKLVDEQTYELTKTGEIKELLINIISHDMIAPLRYISFISGILEKNLEKDPEKIAGALADIKNTSGKIMTDSLSIINWMKYNSQRVSVTKNSVNLYNLVNEIIETYIPIAKTKGITIKNEIGKSKFADIDYNIFTIIITNLVSNAVKYSRQGEIKIQFGDSPFQQNQKILRVIDNGPGIPKEVLPLIIELIKGNISAIKTSSKNSTGLGYLLISELLRIHGLTIAIDTEQGKGTSVSILMGES